jgi:hypothetical protein
MSKDLFFDEQEAQFDANTADAQAYAEQEQYLASSPVVSEISPGTILRLTKQNVAEFHSQMKAIILEGGYGMFEYLEVIKFFGKLNDHIFGAQGKEGDKEFQDAIVDEIKKYGKEHQTARGVTFKLAETGTKYDYSHNPAWAQLSQQAKDAAEKKSQLEDKLKKIPAGSVLVDEETGESLIGPSKSSKSSFQVIFGK